MRGVWRRWLKMAEILGNVQMIILLSLIYWTFVTFMAVPFKLLADPLSLKHPGRVRWTQRRQIGDILESMRRQG